MDEQQPYIHQAYKLQQYMNEQQQHNQLAVAEEELLCKADSNEAIIEEEDKDLDTHSVEIDFRETEQFKETITELCNSKVEEFSMLGYEHVTADEIRDCVFSKYKKETPAFHQIVNDVLSLKVTQFMNWLTMSSVYMKR